MEVAHHPDGTIQPFHEGSLVSRIRGELSFHLSIWPNLPLREPLIQVALRHSQLSLQSTKDLSLLKMVSFNPYTYPPFVLRAFRIMSRGMEQFADSKAIPVLYVCCRFQAHPFTAKRVCFPVKGLSLRNHPDSHLFPLL